MALFATTSDNWQDCGTDGYPPCPESAIPSTPYSTTAESSTAWASDSASASASVAPPPPRPMTSSVGYILIGVAITIVIILLGAGLFYWRRRRRAAAPPPLDPVSPRGIEKTESDAEKGYAAAAAAEKARYADVRLDTAVSELDPGPGGMGGRVFIAELDGSPMAGGCMELDSSPVMAVSPIAAVRSNLYIPGGAAATSVRARNSQFAPSVYSFVGTARRNSEVRGSMFAGTGTGAGAGAGVSSNTFVAELEAPMSASAEANKSIELEGNAAPQLTEVEIPSSILFTVKKGSSSGEN